MPQNMHDYACACGCVYLFLDKDSFEKMFVFLFSVYFFVLFLLV